MEPLDTALSPSRIAAIVGNWPHLKAMGIAIEECEVRNIRPGTEGDLQLEYRFKLVNARTADRFQASIVGTVYPDQRGQQEYTRLLERWKDKEQLLADSSLQGLALYLPEHRLLLHSSLTDEKLPGLQTALDPGAMIGLLGACLQANQPAAERIHHCETYILRYKPGKRCTLRYRLEWIDPETRATRQQSMIGKLYGDGKEGARIFGLMQGLEKHGFGVNSTDGIQIPRLYGYLRELQMLLMEDIPDPTLTESFGSPHMTEHLQIAALALRKLHHCPLKLGREFKVADQLASLRRAVSKIVPEAPDLAGLFEESLAQILSLAPHLPPHELSLVHRDFQYNQLLLGKDRATLVDFDTMSNADPALDVGDFLAHLKWKELQLEWSEAEARSFTEAFLNAYGGDLLPELRVRIDFYYRAYLLRIACRVALRRKWQHLTASLLHEALAPRGRSR